MEVDVEHRLVRLSPVVLEHVVGGRSRHLHEGTGEPRQHAPDRGGALLGQLVEVPLALLRNDEEMTSGEGPDVEERQDTVVLVDPVTGNLPVQNPVEDRGLGHRTLSSRGGWPGRPGGCAGAEWPETGRAILPDILGEQKGLGVGDTRAQRAPGPLIRALCEARSSLGECRAPRSAEAPAASGVNPRRERADTDDMEPGLALVMIVRDEADHLGRCLESAREVCDDIIVLDTGSTDATMQIARAHGARVFEQPWADDFSAARNRALEEAHHEWILQLDADERLHADDLPQLRAIVDMPISRESPPAVHQLYIENELPSGGVSSFYSPRLFPNGHGIHYQGVVHNQLVFDLPSRTTEIRLRHTGYSLDPERMRRKFERSAPLLRRQTRERPDDPYPPYYLASFCFNQGVLDEAIDSARASLARGRSADPDPLLEMATWDLLGLGLERAGDLEGARDAFRRALAVDPTFVDAHFDLAHLEDRSGRTTEAIAHYQAYFDHRDAWRFSPRATRIILRTVDSPAIVWNNLGACYRRAGRAEDACLAFRTATQLQPDLATAQRNLACLLAAAGHFEAAEPHFRLARQGVVPEPETGNQHAVLLIRLGRSDEALAIFEDLRARFPDDSTIHRNLAQLRSRLADPEARAR